jgi:hypothetical protein
MNLKAFTKRISQALGHEGRKSTLKILKEYFWLKLTKPLLAEQYFIKHLYREDSGNLNNYINTNRLHKKYWDINEEHFTPAFEMKDNFEKYLSQFGINVVKTLAYNHKAIFVKNGKLELIGSPEDFFYFINNLPVERSMFIKKKEDSFGGKNIFKITPGQLKEDRELLNKIYSEVIKAGYIYQNQIIQHEELNKLNPNSINCVRIVTYTNKDKIPRILGITQKTSLSEAYVDNVSFGGGFIPLDMQNGILYNKIYTGFEKNKGEVYYKHPVTGFKPKGFRIPYFREAKELALYAAKSVPQIILVGWDIAITPDGPLIIEGNIRPGLNDHEIAQKGFRNNPVYLNLLKDTNEKPIYS